MNPNPPAPPRPDNLELYWVDPPPEKTARCAWWEARIAAGWVGNKRIQTMSYEEAAPYFGVYYWEYLQVLWPALRDKRLEAQALSQVG